MSENKRYSVVQFEKGDISVVPTNWIENDKCLWPPGQKNLRTSIIKRIQPGETWKPFSFKIIKNFDDYESALQAEKDAVASTTEDEARQQRPGKRKIKRKKNPNMYNVPVLSENEDEVSDEIEDSEGLIDNNVTNNNEYTTEADSNSDVLCLDQVQEVCLLQSIATDKIIDNDNSTASGNTPQPCEILHIENAPVISSDDKFQLLLDIALETKAIMQLVLEAVNASGVSIKKRDCLKDDKIRDILPLRTVRLFLEFEENVKIDYDLENQLFNKLSLIGGTNYKNFIRRSLPVLFTNELGILCSWTGQKSNFRVADTGIIRIFKNAVKHAFPGTTDKEFEIVVAEWLRFSKQRSSREN